MLGLVKLSRKMAAALFFASPGERRARPVEEALGSTQYLRMPSGAPNAHSSLLFLLSFNCVSPGLVTQAGCAAIGPSHVVTTLAY